MSLLRIEDNTSKSLTKQKPPNLKGMVCLLLTVKPQDEQSPSFPSLPLQIPFSLSSTSRSYSSSSSSSCSDPYSDSDELCSRLFISFFVHTYYHRSRRFRGDDFAAGLQGRNHSSVLVIAVVVVISAAVCHCQSPLSLQISSRQIPLSPCTHHT
jgi:hypothetical protein